MPKISIFKSLANTNRKKLQYISIITCGVAIATIACTGVRFGFKVSYSGKSIAVVENPDVIDSALTLATESVSDKNAENALRSPDFHLTLTVSDKLESATSLAESIIANSDDIEKSCALKVNGKAIAFGNKDELNRLLEERRHQFDIEGAKNTASFIDEVELEEGIYLKNDINTVEEAEEIINSLKVKTISVTASEVLVPFKTVKKTDKSKTVGYSEVETKGENGVRIRTESVESINGKVNARKELSNLLSVEATDEVIVVGTAIKTTKSAGNSGERSSGFICPISSGKYYISSYFGDGRGHKGMDFCANRGTYIYAAGGGTVTYAGYDSDFGYNVIITHSNGVKTRYAHADSLAVKSGQVVAQGDMIATVGSTGWSTGNHLHFELIINGARVNPAPYIGIY